MSEGGPPMSRPHPQRASRKSTFAAFGPPDSSPVPDSSLPRLDTAGLSLKSKDWTLRERVAPSRHLDFGLPVDTTAGCGNVAAGTSHGDCKQGPLMLFQTVFLLVLKKMLILGCMLKQSLLNVENGDHAWNEKDEDRPFVTSLFRDNRWPQRDVLFQSLCVR